MRHAIRPAFALLVLMTITTGVLYPLAVTGLAQALFPSRANGSLIAGDGRPAGSALIGQAFDDPRFFWGRPSATTPFPYNPLPSAASNLGPSNPGLVKAVRDRIAALRAADPGNRQPVPADLVTASGSGLDPHISPASALYQLPRVARARGLDEGVVRELVMAHARARAFGLLGEPVVPVLELNMALEALQ